MSENEIFKTLVIEDATYETRFTRKFASRKRYEPGNPGQVTARIPGLIQRVEVRPGQRVRRGEALLVLEAMKMANEIGAPRDGVVRAVHVSSGEMVAKGQLLVELA